MKIYTYINREYEDIFGIHTSKNLVDVAKICYENEIEISNGYIRRGYHKTNTWLKRYPTLESFIDYLNKNLSEKNSINDIYITTI